MSGRRSRAARDDRRQRAAEMADRGMATDAIADELGISYATVLSDLKAMGYEFRRGYRGGEWARAVRAGGLVLAETSDRREWSACDGAMWCLPCETRDEALAEVEHPTGVGRVQWYWPTVDALQVIEALEQDACNFAGEYGEDWLGDLRWDSPEVKELQRMLQAAVEEWMRATNRTPALFQVRDVEPVCEVIPC